MICRRLCRCFSAELGLNPGGPGRGSVLIAITQDCLAKMEAKLLPATEATATSGLSVSSALALLSYLQFLKRVSLFWAFGRRLPSQLGSGNPGPSRLVFGDVGQGYPKPVGQGLAQVPGLKQASSKCQ